MQVICAQFFLLSVPVDSIMQRLNIYRGVGVDEDDNGFLWRGGTL